MVFCLHSHWVSKSPFTHIAHFDKSVSKFAIFDLLAWKESFGILDCNGSSVIIHLQSVGSPWKYSKVSRLEQVSNPGLLLYTLRLYQLSHPYEVLGRTRMFSFISFPLYLLGQVLVPSVVEGELLLGITFKVGVLMLAHLEAS